MKQLPNLLKQESSSAATLINVLLRMYRDPRDAHRATRSGVLERLVPYVHLSFFHPSLYLSSSRLPAHCLAPFLPKATLADE